VLYSVWGVVLYDVWGVVLYDVWAWVSHGCRYIKNKKSMLENNTSSCSH
jgi:hypothetical protein